MPVEGYDFAGWVTKHDIRCADGVTIKQNAFKDNDGTKVPLVWNHDYSSPNNILGHVILQSKDKGIYGYGFFNESEDAQHAKEMLRHGDISAMSIGAKKIKKKAMDVIHGLIYEVSLVLSGANPGALIDMRVKHSEDGSEMNSAIIYPHTLIHASDDIPNNEEEKEEGESQMEEEKTIGEIMETLNHEQREAVEALIGGVIDDMVAEEEVQHSDLYDEGDEDLMKNNVFNNHEGITLKHVDTEAVFKDAQTIGTLKEAMLQHSITNIEELFPEARNVTQEPVFYRDENTNAQKIIGAITKSPFSRIKTVFADLTEEEARAKGYIKGKEKLEQVFKLLSRSTTPQTVYKKQKLDRDDIIDITDFDVVSWMNKEMRFMLEEELARAALVGDGRGAMVDDKIKEEHIRPIISDDDFYTIKKEFTGPVDLIEQVIKGLAEYKGSGTPSLYLEPGLLADLRLIKAEDGRFLFGDIPSKEAIAARLGVKEIVDTSFMTGQGALLVNLSDYKFGSTRGGEVTTFEDFDIDFNQHKYLIETRLCGALTLPKSAIHFAIADPEEVSYEE